MIESTGIVAFIHAKGSSERVPSKNKQYIGEKPLYAHAVSIAMQSKEVAMVAIDSDDDEILAGGERLGAVPVRRAPGMSTNATAGDELEYWAARNAPMSEAIAVVIPTSPFLSPESVDGAIRLLRERQADSVAGVRSAKLFLWENGRPAYGCKRTTQAMPWTTWETTGLYIVRTSFALEHQQRINYQDCLPYELPLIESIDIDTPEDLKFARYLWSGMHDV